MESLSLSSEKSHSPSMLTWAQDTGGWAEMARRRLALGGVDLTNSAGKMAMNVINSVARFERDLPVELTRSGLARAGAAGKPLGRPSALSVCQRDPVRERIRNGETIPSIARKFGTGRQTIMRVGNQA